jgi:phosphotransferase system  glucose/maltose/N-acetylglucosamine-specific IIC component
MIISPASNTSSAVTANVMSAGMMSNIGNFVKKNAVMLGVGAVGIGAAIYMMTRKKKRAALSGIPRVSRPKRRKSTNSKRLKPMKLV